MTIQFKITNAETMKKIIQIQEKLTMERINKGIISKQRMNDKVPLTKVLEYIIKEF